MGYFLSQKRYAFEYPFKKSSMFKPYPWKLCTHLFRQMLTTKNNTVYFHITAATILLLESLGCVTCPSPFQNMDDIYTVYIYILRQHFPNTVSHAKSFWNGNHPKNQGFGIKMESNRSVRIAETRLFNCSSLKMQTQISKNDLFAHFGRKKT